MSGPPERRPLLLYMMRESKSHNTGHPHARLRFGNDMMRHSGAMRIVEPGNVEIFPRVRSDSCWNDRDQGISYTTILSAMPRSAACFWIGVIACFSKMVATPGESITGAVTWISCEVDRLCTRAAMFTVCPK